MKDSPYLCKDAVLPNFVQRNKAGVTIHCHEDTTGYNHLKITNGFISEIQKEQKMVINSQHGSFAFCCTSSLDRTGMDLAVVSPACPCCAAALLLGGVARQDVVAKVGVIQVIVTLFPLLSWDSGWRDWSCRFRRNISCWWTKKTSL